MNCNECKHNVLNESVPRSVYESSQAQANVNNRRLFIALLITIILLVATNLAWIIYEAQMETVTERWEFDVDQDAEDGGNAVLIGGDYYGKAEGQSYENDDAPCP